MNLFGLVCGMVGLSHVKYDGIFWSVDLDWYAESLLSGLKNWIGVVNLCFLRRIFGLVC